VDADALVAEASATTGLDDFDGTEWREGLDLLVDSITADAQLSEVGELAVSAQITSNLTNRLRIVDWVRTHPEVVHAPVERPRFVLGLPRTGTTLLSYLLDCDPATRSLLRWEAMDPIPPPELATFTTDPRIAAAEESSAMLDLLNPGFKAIHYEPADGPTECVTLFAQDFRSLLWETVVNVPAYGEWLLDGCDYTSAYAHHRRALQVLQSGAPGRWALKSPAHCFALDTLVAEYPDAELVMTHRDPFEVCASLCSLVTNLSGTFSDADHRDYIVRHWVDVAQQAVERVMRFRDREGDDRFVDVRYDTLLTDPVGSVRAIYTHFGDELSEGAATAMGVYAAANRQGTHGTHRYDPADYGLDRAAVDARFAEYRDRFDV
jgi:hypothetical protein